MKQSTMYSTVLVILMLMIFSYSNKLFSQVKIGDNPKSINPDAMLEIESTDKGLLLPRIALLSTTNSAPLKNFTKGMVVYNTSTDHELTPGLYYSDGTKWLKATTNLVAAATDPIPIPNQNQYWSLLGNNAVTTNSFLGSTNNAALIIKTNNSERLRITEKGWVGVGTSVPKAALEVKGQLVIDSISTGTLGTDKILVANPNDGRVKYIPAPGFIYGVQNYNETVAYNGKTIFTTPSIITDVNKIFLYS